jgi:hypothetical protein
MANAGSAEWRTAQTQAQAQALREASERLREPRRAAASAAGNRSSYARTWMLRGDPVCWHAYGGAEMT